jgi:LysR family transcriptional regulator, hydrogen peroxide-inducible genes activator
MNLRDLGYLVALADHRHFGRAAQACYVSQPTLSMQVKKLERELGVQLVERNPRHVMLTPAGELIVERAREMVRSADEIREIARRTADPESGSLKLGIFPTLGPYLLPHVVPAITERFSRLELLLIEAKTDEILAGLRDGRIDVGVLALPINDTKLVCETLFDEDFVLAVPDGHPLADGSEPVPLSVLAGESVLLLDDGHCLRDQALSVCTMTGATERGGFRATSLETLRQMVAAGVGITLIPRLAAQPPMGPTAHVHLRSFQTPTPQRTIAMFWRPTNPMASLMPQLATILRSVPDHLVTARD